MLASSASAIINGIVAITLLPKFGRMQRATPHVIMDNETMSNKCCHENEMIFFSTKNRHKAQRKAKFYINKCRSASCMQGGLKQASA